MFADRIFFTLLLLFLPTQLSRYFFPDFSLVAGSRIDYLSPAIYLTDILLITTICFWVIRARRQIVIKTIKAFRFHKKYLLFVLFCLLFSIAGSENKEVAIIKFIKFIELFLLFLYIFFEKVSFRKVLSYLIIGGVYSSFIAFFQFIKQGSLGGIFWLLGERKFTFYTPNIAKASIFGKLYLRPYATFPHPNVLAGYISLLLPFISLLLLRSKKIFQQLVFGTVFLFLTLTLFLTMSRTSIVLSFISIVILLKANHSFLKKFLIILLPFFIFGYLFWGRFYNLATGVEDTIYQRTELISNSIIMIKTHPVFGVGLNNFIPTLNKLSYYARANAFFQPVHNVFLLIAAETGFVGLAIFFYLLHKTYQNIRRLEYITRHLFIIMFVQILILSSFDHYFYTLQQTQLLFTILISLMLKKDKLYVKNG